MEATVDRLIAEAAAKEAFELPALWSPHTRPFEAVNRFNQMALGWSAPNGAFVPGDMFATLACWDAPKLKRLIMANAPADGLTDEGRAKALARIDGKILALEVEEERLCRALEAETGVATLRREDANLAIMLAPDVELEAA